MIFSYFLYTALDGIKKFIWENVIDYYKKDCYEKNFFELVEYQKGFKKKYQNTITYRLFLCNHGIFIFLK